MSHTPLGRRNSPIRGIDPQQKDTAPRTRRGLSRTAAGLTTLALIAAGCSVAALPAAAAPGADSTLVVHADQSFRPVTHVATGSLYGLADDGVPSDALIAPIKPNTFVQPPPGEKQQPLGDAGKVLSTAQRNGAKVVIRLVDYYAGWPYQYDPNTWIATVQSIVKEVQASGATNIASYAIWNESDNTWLAQNGSFEDMWTKTYRAIRDIDPTTPIQGPSFSDNISDMQNFLNNAVATNTVPDIIAWHELERSSKIQGDIQTVTAMEQNLGITPRPIDIEEYASPQEVGLPGPLVGYISKFERFGVNNAELAFWNHAGTLGDLLTDTGAAPNGAYWLYTWYAAMSGDMVTTTPPSNDSPLDGAASVTADKKEVDVIAGGGKGSTTVNIQGLDKLALGSNVNVKLEYTPSYGRTTPTAGPITISNTTYQVGADGSINVPVVMNPDYGYHVVVTPAATPTDLSGTYTITNVNSGLVLDTADATPAAGTLVDQATGTGSATQAWKLVSAGSGLYKIVNASSGYVLGIQGGSGDNGAPALVWYDSGTDDHLWQVIPDGKGNYKFASYGSGLVLGVTGMSKADGGQVVQWTDGSPTSTCTVDGPRQPGKIGTALDFCHSTSYVTLPTGTVSSLTGDYTVSAWVNPTTNASWSRLFDIGTGPEASMFLTLNAGTLRYAITTGGAGAEQQINGTGLLPTGQWSLVTVTVSGTNGTLYVNGQAVGTNSNMTDHPSSFGSGSNNWIGKSQYGGDPALDAAVDDFNIYSRALSASEVSTLASGQAGNGDVVHYAFDEAGGTTVVDSSGNGRNGTIAVGGVSASTTTATDAQTADHFWMLSSADKTAPTVSLATVPAAPAASGWFTSSPVTVNVTATDDQSTPTVEAALDGGVWVAGSTPGSATVAVDGDGKHSIQARATDAAGNVSAVSTTQVNVDTTAPVSNATIDTTARTVTLRAADNTSGVDHIEYRLADTDAWTRYAAPVNVGTKSASVQYRAVDVAGNTEVTNTASVPAVPVIATKLTASLSSSSTTYGKSAKVTVTVTGKGGTPTGAIRVTEGNTLVASGTLASGKASITLSPTLAAGTHNLTVSYDGDSKFGESSASVKLTVAKAASNTKLQIAPNKVTTKTDAIATATVSSPEAGGTVTFTVTHKEKGKTVTDVNQTISVTAGAANLHLPRLNADSYQVTATYNGTTSVTGSNASQSLTVTK